MITGFLAGFLLSPILLSPIHGTDVQAMGDRACQLVADELGVELEPQRIRTVSIAELKPVVAEELTHLYMNQTETPQEARFLAATEASLLAPSMLGKYAVADREILLVPQVFDTMPEGARTPETIMAVLVHECTHAISHDRTQFTKTLYGLERLDELQAFNALLEGHAELAAERVCEREGCLDALRSVQQSRHALPDNQPHAVRYILHQLNVRSRFAYEQGEHFVRAVYERDGWDGVWSLYDAPPASIVDIERPEWFLHPRRKPNLRVSAWADELADRSQQSGHRVEQRVISHSELTAFFSPLPEAKLEGVGDGFLTAWTVSSVDPDTNASSNVAVYQFTRRRSARRHHELIGDLFAARAELMKRGNVRIAESEHETLACGAEAWKITVAMGERQGHFYNIVTRQKGRTFATLTLDRLLDADEACRLVDELPAR